MESLTDSRTCLIAIEIIEEEQDQPEESHDMDINFTQLEQALEQRRRLKLLLISLTFIISICFISYSVITDIKSQKGLLLLEEIICSENDPDCLSLLCPSSMSYNHQTERCESGDQNIAVLGVVGNIKQMCREGFVWVDWKGQCLRRN